MHKKTKQRVSIINQNTNPIIKIKRQHFIYILKTGVAGFALGITFSLFIGLIVSMAILKPLLKIDNFFCSFNYVCNYAAWRLNSHI